MLNNIFRQNGGLNADQVRANTLRDLALLVGEGSEGNILVIFDPKHYDDYRHVHSEFLRLKNGQDVVYYSAKQAVEQDISFYVGYIEEQLKTIQKPLYLALFTRERGQVDFVIKAIIDKGLPLTYFVI